MNIKKRTLPVAALALMLHGCGNMNMKVWPFDSGSSSGSARGPANSVEYQCDDGKRFFVRWLDNGNTAWLIYPDREVGLPKAASGNRYTNGVATLTLEGGIATLTDGKQVNYSGCKPAAAGK